VAAGWQVMAGGGAPADVPSEGRVLYDLTNLYVSVVAMEPQMDRVRFLDPDRQAPDSQRIFAGDHVEIFLDPPGEGYFQFAADGAGAWFDGSSTVPGWRGYDSNWRVAAWRGPDRYVVEAAIPLASLSALGNDEAVPNPGDQWAINFCRARTMGQRYTAWSDTARGFHDPQRFGLLVFGPRSRDYVPLKLRLPAAWQPGENRIVVAAPEALAAPVTVTAVLERGDDKRQAGAATLPAATSAQEAVLPVTIDLWGASLLTVEARQGDRVILRSRAEVYLFDLPAALQDAAAAVDAAAQGIKAAAGDGAEDAAGLLERAAKLRQAVGALREKAASGRIAANELAAMRMRVDAMREEIGALDRGAVQLKIRRLWSGRNSTVLYDFEGSAQTWQPLEGAGPCTVSQEAARTGSSSLRIDCSAAQAAGAWVRPSENRQEWYPYTHLKLSLFVPARQDAAAAGIQAVVYLKDGTLDYYQHLYEQPLAAGAWTDLVLDLTGRSGDWEFKNHLKPWGGYCRQDVQELGLKLIAGKPYAGPVYLDAVSLERKPDAIPKGNEIYNLSADAAEVGRYQKFELSFNLARDYHNPFDPDEVDVQGVFLTPGGREVRMPGFFYQGYVRRMDRGEERLIPAGRSQWRIRFAPSEIGTYHYRVEVDDGQKVRSELGLFKCVESGGRGFVRINRARDPFHFEMDDGAPYYPIGHNVASVHDDRARALGVNIPASQGTFAYDRMFDRMANAGENFTRLWMTAWSFGIEWTKAYNVNYQGLGRYNLLNAWRLDYVLDEAERRGLRAMLLFANHGEIGDYESDFYGHDPQRMQGSPYWNKYGGPIESPQQIYSSEEALRYYKRRARYIVARWGYSPAVMAWELFNEADLPNFYQSVEFGRRGAEFIRKLSTYVKELDPFDHLVTSGCFRYRTAWARPLMALETLDFNTGHIFTASLETMLYADTRYMQETFDKIFLATEAGLTPFAQDADSTTLAIHRTLWASYMTPAAGTASPWWWVLIDERNLYHHFGALARFAAGEDRRGRKLSTVYSSATNTSGRNLQLMILTDAAEQVAQGPTAAGGRGSAQIMAGGTQARCWVYDPVAFTSRGSWEIAVPSRAKLTVPGLKPGLYRIEIWDTYEGKTLEVVQTEARPVEVTRQGLDAAGGAAQVKVSEMQLEFQTTTFLRDVACRISPAAELSNATPVQPPSRSTP
jgi:hypothetical protein